MGIRTIIFRGKTTSKELPIREFDNIWVEGDLIKNGLSNKYYIHPHGNGFRTEHELAKLMACHEVQPKTVGQFTGLTDKNGKKIFEGDIVVIRYTYGKICAIGDIQFDCGVFGAEWTVHKKSRSMVGAWGQLHNLRRLDDDVINRIEVIGNIYDNPELLGE